MVLRSAVRALYTRCTHTHTHTHKYLFFLVSSSCGLVHYPTAPWLGGKKVLNRGQGLNKVYGSRGPQRHFLPYSPNRGTHPVGSFGWCRVKGKNQGYLNIQPTSAKHLSEKQRHIRLQACKQAIKIRRHSNGTINATCEHTSSTSISIRSRTNKALDEAYGIVSNVQMGQAFLHSLLPVPAMFPPGPSAQPIKVLCLHWLFIRQA